MLEKLKLGWSPQQISGRFKKEINEGVWLKREYVNHESIDQFLYEPKQRGEKLWEFTLKSWGTKTRLGRRSRSVKIHHWASDTRRSFYSSYYRKCSD
jgi:IS30 family transposase